MTNSVPAQSRSVLTFDGQDDYIDFGKNDIEGVFAQGSSAFTISGWVNPHQLTNKATTYGTHNVFFARSSDRYSDNFEFGISESGNLDVYIDEKIDNVIKTFGSGELTIGQWHFFAIIFNAGQLTIYLDEHEYTGSRRGTSLNNATSSVTLGATLHNYNYFTGQLANISVWNHPCTGAEIQRHRHGAIVGNELGLVAYWMLNEGTGATIRDYTANAHGGTLHGNPTWDLAQLPFEIAQSLNEDLPSQMTTVLAPNERQGKRRKGTNKDAQKSADSIQTGISSQLEVKETETAQTGQSEVIVKIPPPEQAQTFAQEEPEKMIDKGSIQTAISSQLEVEETETAQTGQSEVIVSIQPPEQAQIFAQEELEKIIDADSIQTTISSQLEVEETETAQTGQSEVIVSIQPPEQAQTFAQEELEKIIDADSIQTTISSQLEVEETETAQTGQSEVIVSIQPPEQAQTFAQEGLEKIIDADSIQTTISSQLEVEETETAQTGQSEVIVSIQPPEQAQIFAQEELEKIIDADSIQIAISSQLEVEETETAQTGQSEVIVSIQPPEQAQTFAQEESENTMNTEANPKYKILAIDGGGIRGIIPAMILAEIEKRTLKPISSLFDLIAGTSTGGILALGLTKPGLLKALDGSPIPEYSAENLLQIYLEYGVEIFYEPLLERLLGPIEDIFLQPKYSSDGREEIIRQYFGNAPLDKNLKEVFVTSYDIEQRIPIFFTNKLEKQQTESKKFRKLCGGFTLTDAALATSATPTYFAPHRVCTSHNTNGFYTLVDGGIVANNPTNLAIMEAQIGRQEKKQVLNTEDLLVVSLGTGSLTSVYPYDEVKNWGLLQWGRPLLNMVLDGGSEVVAGELERLFESSAIDGKSSYYRFQTFLTSEQEEIDNPKLENLRSLQVLANRIIAEKSQQIDELCSILLEQP